MNYKDLISIIIPTYNRYNLLEKTINSVLNQTYKNWELIVVDDGSTDGTDVLVNELSHKDSRIRYFWQKNSGESVARNKGFVMAKGEYVAFLDSDDLWHKNNLESKFNTIKLADPSVAGVFSSVLLIDKEGQELSPQIIGRITDDSQLSFERFIDGNPIYGGPSNVLFRRQVISIIGGFNEEIQYGEDQLFFLTIRDRYNFIYIDKPLLYYRIHGLNQSLHVKKEIVDILFDNRIQILLMVLNYKEGEHTKLIEKTIFGLRSSQISWHLYYENIKGVEQVLKLLPNINGTNFAFLIDKICFRLAQFSAKYHTRNIEIEDYITKNYNDLKFILPETLFVKRRFRQRFYKHLFEYEINTIQRFSILFKGLSKLNPVFMHKFYTVFFK